MNAKRKEWAALPGGTMQRTKLPSGLKLNRVPFPKGLETLPDKYQKPGFIPIIYFLFCKEEVVYIGSTRHLVPRLHAHQRKNYCDEVGFFEAPLHDLEELEAGYIRRYLPRHNNKIWAFLKNPYYESHRRVEP